jgi:Uma2 family endonuclease
VQPDLFVVCDPAKIDGKGCIGAPDWVMEILSPGTASRDQKVKFDLYEENGVREYWIVTPQEHGISRYVLDAATGRYQPAGDYDRPGPIPCSVFPDLQMDWSDIFPAAN